VGPLDEPAAGTTDAEIGKTAEPCMQLEKNRTVVSVEHDMDFVARIACRVTVPCEGSVLADGPMDALRNDPRVIERCLGR
jgi:urea transport system ATP-binding protein